VKVKNVRTVFRLSSIVYHPSSIVYFAAVVLFLLSCPARGVVEFKDGWSHNINYRIYDDVWVDYQAPYMYTSVTLNNGGSAYDVYGYGHSSINMFGTTYLVYMDRLYSHDFSQVDIFGGSISEGFDSYESSQVRIVGGSIWYLWSHDFSQVNIYGGFISYLQSYGSSQVDISGGSTPEFYTRDSSQVDISRGSIGALYCYDSSQVDIFDGSIKELHSGYSSQVNISGGSIKEDLISAGNSQVNISGGSIGGDLELWWQSVIQIIGSNFAVDGKPFGYGELTSIFGGLPRYEPWRNLTGALASGELIDTDFRIGHDARIILIPEPASVLLMVVGLTILTLRRKKR
jgi:hypothetical protein